MKLNQIKQLALEALISAGADPENAEPLADAVTSAEADGIPSHGLRYIPVYCSHLKCGKVDGQAKPEVSSPTPSFWEIFRFAKRLLPGILSPIFYCKAPAPSVVQVDAKTGFAHPAIKKGIAKLPLHIKIVPANLLASADLICFRLLQKPFFR